MKTVGEAKMRKLASRFGAGSDGASEYLSKNFEWVIGVFALVLSFYIWESGFEGNAGTARYLLSAMGQSLAAILALSFTIPLIAVQLAASKYGIKVYDLFFDRLTKFFIVFTSFSTSFQFYALSKINIDDAEFLTQNNAALVTLSLVLFIIVLFILIVFIFRVKEKLVPENIIYSYTKEIKNLVLSKKLEIARKKIDTFGNIGILLARERDSIAFGKFLEAWIDLLMFEKIMWLKNVLNYEIPRIFKTISKDDETIAKDGLEKLEKIVLGYLDKKEIWKVREVMHIYSSIAEPLVEPHPEVVSHSLYCLFDLEQMSSIDASEPEVTSEVSIAAIENIRTIGTISGYKNTKLVEEAIDRTYDIVNQRIDVESVVRCGVGCIATLREYAPEKANTSLLHISYFISTGASRIPSMPIEYKVKVVRGVLPAIKITESWEVSELLNIAFRLLKDDENSSKEALNEIATMLKGVVVQSMDNLSWLKMLIENEKKYAQEHGLNLPIEDFAKKYLFT